MEDKRFGGTDPWMDQPSALRVPTVHSAERSSSGGHSPRGYTGKRSSAGRSGSLVPGAADLASPTFVAVDFETANRMGGASACSVALVRVTDGVVTDRLSTYLKPPPEFSQFEFTYLHGISKADTDDAPNWFEAASQISELVQDWPVYAHNSPFDSRVWKDLDRYFGLKTLPRRFYCSYRLARSVRPGLVNYKLPTVTREFVPDFQLDHHRADSDAEACALIVATIQKLSS